MRKVAQLIPNARNTRVHSEQQIAQIAASMREWGVTTPILVDEQDGILAGHARVLAATLLGYDRVPVTIARGWSEAQKRAYIIADNKLTENGSWDDALLRIELADLAEAGFDLGLTGFDPADIEDFLGGWGSDGAVLNSGAHTDGIMSAVRVLVPQDVAGAARDAITEALDAAGIEYQLK
jgi:ParB-like chromosome segregation protein Spo0J